MARRTSRQRGRDAFAIARRLRLPLVATTPVNLLLFEDRRSFHPLGRVRPAFSVPRSGARLQARGGKRRLQAPRTPDIHPGLSFAVPDKVILCVRRKRRREVMFAIRKAGKRGQRRPRRNYWSSVSCKR